MTTSHPFLACTEHGSHHIAEPPCPSTVLTGVYRARFDAETEGRYQAANRRAS